MNSIASLGAALLLLLGSSACRDAEPSRRGPSVRDSAGIQVVEHRQLDHPGHLTWRMPDEPRWVVGGSGEGGEAELFRVTSVRRAGDGTIIVANSGTHEVRLFGPEGNPIRSFGREGDGPGEFRFLAGAWPIAGDSILTFDTSPRRIRVFDRSGEVGRTVELSGPTGRESLADVMADGSLITYRRVSSAPGMQRHLRSRILFRRSAAGELLDSLHVVRWQTIVPQEVGPGQFLMGSPIFSSVGQVAVGHDRIYSSDATDPVVEVRDPSGGLVRLIRWSDEDRLVKSEDRESFRQRRLSATETDAERQAMETMLRDAEWSESFPALSDLLADSEGGLWVRPYERSFDAPPPLWWHFDADGHFDREVAFPEGFEPHEIGDDYVLGVTSDDLGVEQVRLYSLEMLRQEGG